MSVSTPSGTFMAEIAAEAARPVRVSPAGGVLLLDDDPVALAKLRDELVGRGFECFPATTGAEALRAACHHAPEVILISQAVWEDALAACRALKNDPLARNVPVLFLHKQPVDDDVAISGLEAGGHDVLDTPSLSILCARLRSQINICRTEANLRRIALTDELTDCFTRRYLLASLKQQIRQASRTGDTHLSFLLLDVDYFKRINDTLGHAAGDDVLKELARRLKNSVRGSDVVARIGGEEFAVLLPATDASGAARVGENLRYVVVDEIGGLKVSVSVGAVTVELSAPELIVDPEGLAQRLMIEADKALYEAKNGGRDRVAARQLP